MLTGSKITKRLNKFITVMFWFSGDCEMLNFMYKFQLALKSKAYFAQILVMIIYNII